MNIYDLSMPVDIDNKGVVYTKVINDLLKELKIIPDDKVEYISCSGTVKFIKVDKEEDIKMVINIYKSDYTTPE